MNLEGTQSAPDAPDITCPHPFVDTSDVIPDTSTWILLADPAASTQGTFGGI